MGGKIIINMTREQTRVALLDNNAELSELYIERTRDAEWHNDDELFDKIVQL